MKNGKKNGHDFSCLTQKEIASLFGISQQAVGMWDCPRNANKSYTLGDVLKWYVATRKEKPEGRVELENQKLTLQCEKMTIDIERMKAESIPLETHRQIMAGRAMSLKNYILEFFAKNIHLYAHKSVDQLRPMSQEHVAAFLNHYSQNHR